MNKDPRDIILQPVVSEKSYALLDRNVYTFLVAPSANKIEIRKAVEEIFNVKVLDVTTMNRQGKRKRNRRSEHVRSAAHHEARHRGASRPTTVSTFSGADARCRCASASQPARGAGSSPSPTSPRSRPTSRRSRSSSRSPGRAAVTSTAASPPATSAAVTSRSTAWSTSAARRTGSRPRSPASSTTPTATPGSALLHYVDGEKRYILAPARVQVGDMLQSGQGAEIRPGNALPMRYIPVGTVIHNVELKPGAGRQDRPGRRHEHPARGQGGRLRHPAAPLDGNAPGPHRLSGHRRRGRQRRVRADLARQGGPEPVEGSPSPHPGRGHEPGRPPARWWRRQELRWTPPDVTLGEEGRAGRGPSTRPPTR